MQRADLRRRKGKGQINALELIGELEKQGNFGIDRLGTLKEILNQLKKRSMVKEM